MSKVIALREKDTYKITIPPYLAEDIRWLKESRGKDPCEVMLKALKFYVAVERHRDESDEPVAVIVRHGNVDTEIENF